MYVYLGTYFYWTKQIMVMPNLIFFIAIFFFNNETPISCILYGCKSFMSNTKQRLGGVPNQMRPNRVS